PRVIRERLWTNRSFPCTPSYKRWWGRSALPPRRCARRGKHKSVMISSTWLPKADTSCLAHELRSSRSKAIGLWLNKFDHPDILCLLQRYNDSLLLFDNSLPSRRGSVPECCMEPMFLTLGAFLIGMGLLLILADLFVPSGGIL